jgi:hypothetical protein
LFASLSVSCSFRSSYTFSNRIQTWSPGVVFKACVENVPQSLFTTVCTFAATVSNRVHKETNSTLWHFKIPFSLHVDSLRSSSFMLIYTGKRFSLASTLDFETGGSAWEFRYISGGRVCCLWKYICVGVF